MRNNPTEPEKRLWRYLSNGQLNGFKIRCQQVIGTYIVDFLCPSKRLVVEIDGHTHDPASDATRDATLAGHGYRVLRFGNADVMRNMDGVLLAILAALDDRAVACAPRPHPNPSPEGKGLLEAF